MELIILICMLGLEITLAVLTFRKGKETKDWATDRLIIRTSQIALFWAFMLLPGISFDFRFKALFILLFIQWIIAVITWFVKRSSTGKQKSSAGLIVKLIGSGILYFFAMIPAFLFTGYNGLTPSGTYKVASTEAILTDETRLETFENDGSHREVPVHFYYPVVEDDSADGSFPLVIFSHGAFGYYQSNTSTYMDLASNGYVVVSLDHPYHSFFTKDTNGKIITVDPEFISNVMYINEDGTPEEEIFALSTEWVNLRKADTNFVIEQLKQACKDMSLGQTWYYNEKNKDALLSALSLADSDNIGLFGHSLGGASSVAVGRERNDVHAVIDLDGTMLGEQASYENGAYTFIPEPYPVPILSVNAEYHHIAAMEYGGLYVNNDVIENALDGSYTYFKNTGHMNFTDLPLFSPILAKQLGTGSISSKECIEKVNELVLMYFNHYLKGEGELVLKEYYE